jgi:hypothetical protein
MGRIQVGATGGSAYGGASSPVNSAGSGVTWARRPRFPRVDDSGTSCSSFAIFRLSRDLPLNRRIRIWYFVSAFPSTSRYWLLHGSPRPCCPVFPSVSFPFVSSSFLHFVPHLCDPGLFSSPYAHVSLQLLSRSPFRFLQFVRFIRRDLRVHIRSSLSPRSFRFSVLLPRFRGSVFVARESRRSALTPLPRSSKGHRVMGGS